MFLHNFKYSLKILFQNKALIFWTILFPLILATCFKMAFSDIEKKETFSSIDIAIVNNSEFKNNTFYKEAFKKLSYGKSKIFNIKYVNLKKCKELLKDSKIKGYLIFSQDKVNIVVKKSGVDETIIRVITDSIISQNFVYKNKVVTDNLYNSIHSDINNQVQLHNITSNNISYTVIEYYTLIAMTILYGSLISMFIINKRLANMTAVGKRISISSNNKTILGSLSASYVVILLEVMVLFIYTRFVLNVVYINPLLTILLALVGSLAGLSLGVAIDTLLKTNDNTKTVILISIIMCCCFLSGMMGVHMKYIIDKNIPIINIINPVNMITDGLYSLYYYNTLNRYLFNVVSLLIFSLVMIIISLKGLKRQKYDSI